MFFLLFFQETKVVRKNALRRAEGMTKKLFPSYGTINAS